MDVDTNSITGIPTLQDYYRYITFNPILITIIVVIFILYLLFFSSLGASNLDDDNGSTNGWVKILGIIVASIFIVLVLVNGFNYFLNIDIVTKISNLFSRHPEIDIIVDTPNFGGDGGGGGGGGGGGSGGNAPANIPEITAINQVYHIPDNRYTYNDAKAICKAYGSRLANYKEIKKAYSDGADWCSYGWSDDQLALFPTQYNKWKHLQQIKGHENDCGRPGINGGYIDNPNVRFGINCYGHKPKITPWEAELMKNTPLYPVTQEELNFEKRVDYWLPRIKDILISPFNNKNWSRI